MNLIEQLRLLSIFHYVVGGLHMLFGSFGLIHFSIGIAFMMGSKDFLGAGPSAPPPLFGLLFAVIGGGFVLFGWTIGILTILSGRYIAARKRRTFSIVMGAVNCAMLPFGTALGVFDLIVLTKDETIQLYAGNGLNPPIP